MNNILEHDNDWGEILTFRLDSHPVELIETRPGCWSGRAEQLIHQGQITRFGNHTQSTYLGSCISLILFSAELKKGGLSHIVGRETESGDFNLPAQALMRFRAIETVHEIKDAVYFIVGGSNLYERLLRQTEKELEKYDKRYSLVDVLGRYSRKILFVPKESKLRVYRKPFN